LWKTDVAWVGLRAYRSGGGVTDSTGNLYKKALSTYGSSRHPTINYPIFNKHLPRPIQRIFSTTQPPSCSSPLSLPLFSPSPPLAQLTSVTRPLSLSVLPVFVVDLPPRFVVKQMLKALQIWTAPTVNSSTSPNQQLRSTDNTQLVSSQLRTSSRPHAPLMAPLRSAVSCPLALTDFFARQLRSTTTRMA
jgi:hypothetical protein